MSAAEPRWDPPPRLADELSGNFDPALAALATVWPLLADAIRRRRA